MYLGIFVEFQIGTARGSFESKSWESKVTLLGLFYFICPAPGKCWTDYEQVLGMQKAHPRVIAE